MHACVDVAAMNFTFRLCLFIPLAVFLSFVTPEVQCFASDHHRTHHHSTVMPLPKQQQQHESQQYKTTSTRLFSQDDEPSLSKNADAQSKKGGGGGLGEYDPSEDIRPEREVVVGDPQIRVKERDFSVTDILKELSAIQQKGPQKYCILGTRHCSYLHQQIIELLYVYIRCLCSN